MIVELGQVSKHKNSTGEHVCQTDSARRSLVDGARCFVSYLRLGHVGIHGKEGEQRSIGFPAASTGLICGMIGTTYLSRAHRLVPERQI